jgi:3-hydroxybutyryl-CoA dehydrogenase
MIGICGAGTMGAGIAIAGIQAGYEIVLFDVREEVVQKAHAYIVDQMAKAVERGKMTQEQADAATGKVRATTSLDDMAPCDIVIEAIIEDRDIKQKLFAALEERIADDAILATNTSSIAVTSLAAGLRHPERFAGMHFFNPAHIMKLVEVIRGAKTSDATVQRIIELSRALGKSPAVAKDVPGFIVNRVARNFYNESMRICMEGAASIEQVDTILKAAGFKMGPFELMDLIGVDTNLQVTKSMWEQYFYEPRFAPSLMQEQYVQAGMWGRKTGEGFYRYDKK